MVWLNSLVMSTFGALTHSRSSLEEDFMLTEGATGEFYLPGGGGGGGGGVLCSF